MCRFSGTLAIAVSTVLAAILVAGCAKQSDETESNPADVPALEPADDPATTDTSASGEMPESFAELSEADQQAALAQKVCPVSHEVLGSMGTPLKVMVADREVFICCESCREELLANTGQYLAELDAQVQ